MTLYRVDVFGDGAVSALMRRGEPVTVEGVQMVRLGRGTIVEASGFCATEEDALRAAADEVERVGLKILEKAAALRRGEGPTWLT